MLGQLTENPLRNIFQRSDIACNHIIKSNVYSCYKQNELLVFDLLFFNKINIPSRRFKKKYKK